MAGYRETSTDPYVLQRVGASPGRAARWMLVGGVLLVPVGAALQAVYGDADTDFAALGPSAYMFASILLLVAAWLLAHLGAGRGLIIAQPRRVEVGERLRVDRHDFARDEVRRVELHHERVPEQGDRWIVAILLRHHVVELVIDDGDEAAHVADTLRNGLPGAEAFTARDRPLFRGYVLVSVLVILVAVCGAMAVDFAPVFADGPLGAAVPILGNVLLPLGLYGVTLLTSRIMTLSYVRTEYGLDR